MSYSTLAARLEVQGLALRAVLGALSDSQRAQVAAALQAGVAGMLAERGSLPADADEAVTAELAALLGAASQPARL